MLRYLKNSPSASSSSLPFCFVIFLSVTALLQHGLKRDLDTMRRARALEITEEEAEERKKPNRTNTRPYTAEEFTYASGRNESRNAGCGHFHQKKEGRRRGRELATYGSHGQSPTPRVPAMTSSACCLDFAE